jgi:hypothetical protein
MTATNLCVVLMLLCVWNVSALESHHQEKSRKKESLVCSSCGQLIARDEDLLHFESAMAVKSFETRDLLSSKTVPLQRFVNPQGFSFDVFTMHHKDAVFRQTNLLFTEFSWFPGYAWKFASCIHCGQHLGWGFEAVAPNHPNSPSSSLPFQPQPQPNTQRQQKQPPQENEQQNQQQQEEKEEEAIFQHQQEEMNGMHRIIFGQMSPHATATNTQQKEAIEEEEEGMIGIDTSLHTSETSSAALDRFVAIIVNRVMKESEFERKGEDNGEIRLLQVNQRSPRINTTYASI